MHNLFANGGITCDELFGSFQFATAQVHLVFQLGLFLLLLLHVVVQRLHPLLGLAQLLLLLVQLLQRLLVVVLGPRQRVPLGRNVLGHLLVHVDGVDPPVEGSGHRVDSGHGALGLVRIGLNVGQVLFPDQFGRLGRNGVLVEIGDVFDKLGIAQYALGGAPIIINLEMENGEYSRT